MFYTGKGDDGKSGILGTDARCNKDEPIFHALGTVDELNSLLGVCYAKVVKEVQNDGISLPEILRSVQEDLFIVQAELAGAKKSLKQKHVTHVEEVIAELTAHIENPKAFVMSGSSEISAYIDFARSVSRRVERSVLAAESERAVSKDTKAYLNRLSSLLYVLARYVAVKADVKEQNPKY